MDDCQKNFEIISHPLFYSSQLYHLAVLFPGIGALIYLVIRKLLFSRFHGNLKFLMIGYFGSILLHAIRFVTLTIYMLIHINKLNINNPCGVYIDKYIFKYGYIASCITYSIPMIFSLAISIERLIATSKAESYETFKIIIGPILFFIVIPLDVLSITACFRDESFNEQMATFAFTPYTSATNLYTFYGILCLLNLVNAAVNVWLFKRTEKLKKQYVMNLTTRYQLDEVAHSTQFCTVVIFLNSMFFGIYMFFALSLRYFGHFLFENPTTLQTVRNALPIGVSTNITFTGLLSIYVYAKIKAKKALRMQLLIAAKNNRLGVMETRF